MHAVFTNLMGGLLFVHAAFGCCWHHAHASDQCHNVPASTLQADHGCQHHDDNHDSQPPEKPCKCKLECQGVCTYLRPDKVQIDSPQVVRLDFVAVIPTVTGSHMSAVSLWELAGGPAQLGPPLRLHLQHQILLI